MQTRTGRSVGMISSLSHKAAQRRREEGQSQLWPSVRELKSERWGERVMVKGSLFISWGRLAGREKAGGMTFLNGSILREPLGEKQHLLETTAKALRKNKILWKNDER